MKLTTVTHLFVKRQNGQPVQPVKFINVDTQSGIEGAIRSPLLRHALLISRETLQKHNIQPGELKENIILDGMDVHELPSGSILKIGSAQLRINFHCETCSKVAHLAKPSTLQRQRGVLATFLTNGRISLGDEVHIAQEQLEPIPYNIRERIKWFFDKNPRPIGSTDLVDAVGLSVSYCRVLPRYMQDMPQYADLVQYKRKSK